MSYRPRLSIDLSEEQARELNRMFEYGQQRLVFSAIIDDLISMYHDYGHVAIALIASKQTKPREIVPKLSNAEKGATLIENGGQG